MAVSRENDGTSPGHGDSNAAAAAAPKHKRLLRTARRGRILSALMLPFLQVSPPDGYGVLTTTGRRTGKPRRRCVRVIRRGSHAYLVQLIPPHVALDHPDFISGWLLNIRANPRVRLRISGGSCAGAVREISDPAEREVARSAICETVTWTDYGEATLHLRGRPTRVKIEEMHRYWFDTGRPLVIDLDG